MQEVNVYEELRQDGVTYEQIPDIVGNCGGCRFNNSFSNCPEDTDGIFQCIANSTIWIKKMDTVKEEPMKDTPEQTTHVLTKVGTKHDQEKDRYDLIPVLALEEVAKVLTAGSHKYNEDYNDENWRKVPNATRRYFSATQRHLAWVRKGQTHDSETGLHHYAHAITNLMFLLEKELENK